MAIGFVVMILIGAVLLWLPISYVGIGRLAFIDALFMATSATCVTGLSVINTGAHLSAFGEIVLILLVQIGGEVTSAYATAGMSVGLTSQLTGFGKVFIIILMFVGRLGPVTLAYTLSPLPKKEPYRYPEGKITIG